MADMVHQKAVEERLHPSRFHSRFYHLTQLRDHVLRVVETYVKPLAAPVLIDYGCGDMPYRAFFTPYVKQYVGADLSENPVAEVILTDKGRLPETVGDADIVLSTQVLEHVDDPALYLDEAFRVLKPGGLLIISTHGYWMYHPTPGDYWRWTGSGLRKTLAKAGFTIVDFQGIMGLAPTSI